MRMTAGKWVVVRTKQAAYSLLGRAVPFDRWHSRVVRENCGYFAQVRELHGRLHARTTIEIGCGLGEIVSALAGEVRIGIDRDAAVIRAARLLRPRAVRFFVADEITPQDLRAQLGHPVCLVLLNWLHASSAADVRTIVGEYLQITAAAHVIFDVISAGASGYQHNHPPDVLGDLGTVVTVQDADDAIRRLVLVDTRAAAAKVPAP